MSDQQVSKQARAALRALAVFPPKPNTFAEEAAVTVSALPVETLDELTDAGLLESSGPERYTLHQTIADYARTYLTDQSVTGRLVDYFVSYVEAHAADALARESEHRTIEAQVLRELGGLAWAQGQLHQAHLLLAEALDMLRQLGEQRGVADTLNRLGKLVAEQGEPERGRLLCEEALAVYRDLKDQRGIAMTLRSDWHWSILPIRAALTRYSGRCARTWRRAPFAQ